MLKRLWAAVLTAGLVGGAGFAADDAIMLKMKKAAKGDVVKETKTEDVDTKVVVTAGGQTQTLDQGGASKQVYTDEILEKGEKDTKPTKMSRKYDTLEVTKAGKKLDLGMDGKTVLIEKKKGEDKFTFTEDGKAVTGDAAELLDKEFNKKDDSDMEEKLLPKKAVKAGDTWEVDAKTVAKVFGEEMTVDEDKAKVTGKLVKLYDKDKAKFGVIEYTIELPVTAVAINKQKIDATAGSKLKMTITVDTCVDGSVYGGTSTAKVDGEVGMSAMGADLTITTSGTMKSKAETVKK